MEPDRVVFGKLCALCGQPIERGEPSARLTVRSRRHGFGTFAAHAACLRAHLHPDVAHALDLADVPPDDEPFAPEQAG